MATGNGFAAQIFVASHQQRLLELLDSGRGEAPILLVFVLGFIVLLLPSDPLNFYAGPSPAALSVAATVRRRRHW